MHLALYCFANNQLSTALNLLYRARYLMLLVFGEGHPEMALLDVSIAIYKQEVYLLSCGIGVSVIPLHSKMSFVPCAGTL